MTLPRHDLRYDPVDRVDLQLAAEFGYLPVVRAVAGNVAMIEDYTADDIADFRLAADEVCSTLIALAPVGSTLDCRFAVHSDHLTIRVDAQAVSTRLPERDSLAWRILTSVCDQVTTQIDALADPLAPWRIRVDIVKRRAAARLTSV